MSGKNVGGRPRKVYSDDYERRATLYISSEPEPTAEGMARFLGFADLTEFVDTADSGREGTRGVRIARSIMCEYYEKLLRTNFSAGAQTALQKLGWKNTQVIRTEVKAVNLNMNLTASLDDVAKLLHPSMEEQQAS